MGKNVHMFQMNKGIKHSALIESKSAFIIRVNCL